MKRLFTLIELITVIVIISILAAIVVPNISDMSRKAQVTALNADAQVIELAVDKYSLDNRDSVPTLDSLSVNKDTPKLEFKDEDGVSILLQAKQIDVDKLVSEGYLKKGPKNKKARFYLILGGDVIWVLDDLISSNKPVAFITVEDGKVKVHTENEVVVKKYEKGSHNAQHFKDNGIVFIEDSFPVLEEGIYTIYYEFTDGSIFLKEIEVKRDMLSNGNDSGEVVEQEPNVTISVSLGEVTVIIDEPTSSRKYNMGSHEVAYFENKGSSFTGDNFLVSEVGKYTIYYQLTDGREFVSVFEVTEDMLPPNVDLEEPTQPDFNEPEVSMEYEYKVNGDSVTIERYIGQRVNIVIPSHIEDKPVEIIGVSSFRTASNNLKSVVIPDTVKRIEDSAFYENNLEEIIIPDSVIYIGNGAFSRNNLVNVKLPNKLVEIKDNVFNTNRLTNIDIPETVTKIGVSAFSNNQLTNLVIPDKVYFIESAAFSDNKLNEVTLPNSLVLMGMRAFYNNELVNITIPSKFNQSGYQNFYGNPNLKTVINKSNVSNSVLMSHFDSSPTISK